MQAKGSIFRSINDYVLAHHASEYSHWKDNLSNDSRRLIEYVKCSEWYPIQEGLIEPSEVICNIAGLDEKAGAWEMGRFSAEQSLTGIYKVFIMVTTPEFILKRAPRIITTYYNPSQLKIRDSHKNGAFIGCDELPTHNPMIEYRIAGWIERAGEICGCQNMKVEIQSSLSKGDQSFEIVASWD